MIRLDQAVSRRFGLARRAARDAVRTGRVDLDGRVADEPGRSVPEDAGLELHSERPERRRVRTRLAVLYENTDLIIVDKPAGLLTVPTSAREGETLLARVLEYLHHRYRRRPSAFVVHRLDKDTSGAVVFARTRPALLTLQDLFRRHEIEREYVAIVEGSGLADSGLFDARLVRESPDRRRSVARTAGTGRRAVTRYRVLERFRGAALVSVALETGRTHQIRIHFASAGHPVLGDSLYGGQAGLTPSISAPRQMLHARVLGLAHPRTGTPVRVESPIPPDFADQLERLRRASDSPRGPQRPNAFQKKKRPGLSRGV